MRQPGNSFRPRPPLPTQLHSNANPSAPGTSQGFSGNPSQGNSPYMFQSSAPMLSSQTQMGGGMNPQTMNNPGGNNGQFMPNNNMPPPMMMMMPQQPACFNAPNMMAPQLNPGFPPQNYQPNMVGGGPMFMNPMNFQQQGQLVLQLATLVQQLSQSGGLLNMPNPMMQNVNPMLQNVNPMNMPVQMPNLSQVGPGNMPPNCLQPPGTPSPNMFPNQMFGAGQQPNPNQQNFMMLQQQQQQQPPQPMGASLPNSLPAPAQIGPGNSAAPQPSFQAQPSSFPGQQGNFTGNAQNSSTNSQWGSSAGKDFKHHSIKEGSQPGYKNSQFHQNDNKKRNFEVKGRGHERPSKFGGNNPATSVQTEGKKRTFIPNYPEHEVKQWRELRKKNYPTKCNVDKKQALKLADAEAIEKETKMRREQLKEVLAKQAELGLEVAEVPSYYLLDSEKKLNREGEKQQGNPEGDGRWQKKKGRFQKGRERRNKRGQQFSNQGIATHDKKEPTLLQKLLSADIKKDNQRLFQSFRFMAMNSFFKDGAGKPLSFPKVVVQEGIETVVVEEKADSGDGTPEEVKDERGTEVFPAIEEYQHPGTDLAQGKVNIVEGIAVTEEEEGEIIN